MIYDLIGHGLTLAFVIYFGLHLRQKVQTLQTTVAAQEKTIAAQEKAITGQAEQMKAQSTVLQDVERFNKMMQQAIDFREQAYQELVERDATKHQRERLVAWYAAVRGDGFDRRRFATSEAYATLKGHLPEALQQQLDQSRDPDIVLLPSSTGIDPIQAHLLEEIARLEREWGLI